MIENKFEDELEGKGKKTKHDILPPISDNMFGNVADYLNRVPKKMIEEITINDTTFEVKEIDLSMTPQKMGQFNQIDGVIYINKNMKEDTKLNTLVHEVCHGVFRFYSAGIDTEREEAIIESMSNGLYSVMKRNPDFIKMFLDE